MDQVFDKIECDAPVTINTSGAREHVGKIERHIRTLKERYRCCYAPLPFSHLPLAMIVHLVYFLQLWKNTFPSKHEISSTLSPREIVTKLSLKFDIHCQSRFGEYVEAHEDHIVTNNVQELQTFPAIVLGPTGNLQGTVKVFDIKTGRVKKVKTFDRYPMPDSIIEIVNAWGEKLRKQKRAQELAW